MKVIKKKTIKYKIVVPESGKEKVELDKIIEEVKEEDKKAFDPARLKAEIINLLLDKALTKVEYYKSKSQEMKIKYGINFEKYKRNVGEAKNKSGGYLNCLKSIRP
jgi:hypothetical protein